MSTDTQAVSRSRSSSESFGRFCQSTLLLLIRIYFFWQLFKIGLAKLEHIETVIGYFTKLEIPYPDINAWVVSATECFGSILIVAGFAFPPCALPLTHFLAVSFLVGGKHALRHILG